MHFQFYLTGFLPNLTGFTGISSRYTDHLKIICNKNNCDTAFIPWNLVSRFPLDWYWFLMTENLGSYLVLIDPQLHTYLAIYFTPPNCHLRTAQVFIDHYTHATGTGDGQVSSSAR